MIVILSDSEESQHDALTLPTRVGPLPLPAGEGKNHVHASKIFTFLWKAALRCGGEFQ